MQSIGFIGQGFIGKNYADDFAARGYHVVRYGLEPEYVDNKQRLASCTVIFIAVPTPTTPQGFDFSAVADALSLVPRGAMAVIKSTLLPGTTESLQHSFPGVVVLHSPEFLREKTAAYDAAHPARNIIGMPMDDEAHRTAARLVLDMLPKAPYELITTSRTAELVKYGGNCFLYTKVVFMNLLYDLAQHIGADFDTVAQAMAADDRIGSSHMHPVSDGGRGAGGHCFIKDFAAFEQLYREKVHDVLGAEVLHALQQKNTALLRETHKDLDLLQGVVGETDPSSKAP